MRVHAAQHVAHVLAPIFLAHAEGKGSRSAAGEYAHRAIARFEPMLHMERRPRAALLVLRKGNGAVGVAVSLRAHVTVTGKRPALEILR